MILTSSADGTRLAAASIGGKVRVSDDSGTSWTGVTPARNWNDIASSDDGSTLLACTSDEGCWTSADYGTSWTDAGVAGEKVDISDDGSVMLVGVRHDLTLLHISRDGGANWTVEMLPSAGSEVYCSSDGSTLLFAACVTDGDADVYVSRNGGQTWDRIAAPYVNWSTAALSGDGTRAVLGMQEGILYTWDAVCSTTSGPSGHLTGSGNVTLVYSGSDRWVVAASSIPESLALR